MQDIYSPGFPDTLYCQTQVVRTPRSAAGNGWLTIDSLSKGTFFSGCAEIICVYIAFAFWASALGQFCAAMVATVSTD